MAQATANADPKRSNERTLFICDPFLVSAYGDMLIELCKGYNRISGPGEREKHWATNEHE